MHTYATALALSGITVPAHLIADAEVPVLTGPQAQGDLLIFPAPRPAGIDLTPIPASGVQVVHGESTGNTHWLHQGFDSAGVRWARVDTGPVLGYLSVPDGETAQLIHTDEHGANAVGAGTYVICRQREQADEIRLVAD